MKLLSNNEKRQIYDKTGLTEDQFGDGQGYEHFFRDQQHFQFQYVRWTPPRRQQNDLINFVKISKIFQKNFIFLDFSIC